MLGTRGCRLGIVYPEIYEMQVAAIVRAATAVEPRPRPEIMLPLIAYERELEELRMLVVRVASDYGLAEQRDYTVGTMIQLPRACRSPGSRQPRRRSARCSYSRSCATVVARAAIAAAASSPSARRRMLVPRLAPSARTDRRLLASTSRSPAAIDTLAENRIAVRTKFAAGRAWRSTSSGRATRALAT